MAQDPVSSAAYPLRTGGDLDLINRGELRAYRLGSKMIRLDLTEVDALMVPLDSPADRLPIRPSVRKFRNAPSATPMQATMTPHDDAVPPLGLEPRLDGF